MKLMGSEEWSLDMVWFEVCYQPGRICLLEEKEEMPHVSDGGGSLTPLSPYPEAPEVGMQA